jgi:hypothetical protein
MARTKDVGNLFIRESKRSNHILGDDDHANNGSSDRGDTKRGGNDDVEKETDNMHAYSGQKDGEVGGIEHACAKRLKHRTEDASWYLKYWCGVIPGDRDRITSQIDDVICAVTSRSLAVTDIAKLVAEYCVRSSPASSPSEPVAHVSLTVSARY